MLQQQPRSSGIYRQNAYEKKKKKNWERKRNIRYKRTMIVGSEVVDCYGKVVLRFKIEVNEGKVDGCD